MSAPRSCAGPPDDGGQHLVEVPQRSKVAGGVEQGGELGLPPTPALEQRPDLQRRGLRLLQVVDHLAGLLGGPGLQDGSLELDHGRLACQQLEKGPGRVHGSHPRA